VHAGREDQDEPGITADRLDRVLDGFEAIPVRGRADAREWGVRADYVVGRCRRHWTGDPDLIGIADLAPTETRTGVLSFPMQ
jgi:hypothetical protein